MQTARGLHDKALAHYRRDFCIEGAVKESWILSILIAALHCIIWLVSRQLLVQVEVMVAGVDVGGNTAVVAVTAEAVGSWTQESIIFKRQN